MENTKKPINWVERVYNKLTAPKTIEILGLVAVVLFFGLFISAVIVALPPGPIHMEPYTIIDNWISDMGNHEHTPAPWLLDSALISTGILLLPFIFYIERYLAPIPRRPEDLPATQHRFMYRLTGIAYFLNLMGSVGMVGVGVFSEDRDYLLPGSHFAFSIMLFGCFALGAIALGLALTISDRKLIPSPWNYILGTYGVHGLLLAAGFAGYHLLNGTSLEKLMEWVIFFALVAWMIPLFFCAMLHARKQMKNDIGT